MVKFVGFCLIFCILMLLSLLSKFFSAWVITDIYEVIFKSVLPLNILQIVGLLIIFSIVKSGYSKSSLNDDRSVKEKLEELLSMILFPYTLGLSMMVLARVAVYFYN